MKAKTTILASLLVLAGAASGDDVAVLEGKLKADILDKVDQANPIDSATGARKFISFAMISDIHKCRRVEGDDAATDPVTTYWYGSASCLTEAEQSIRLLGSLATEAGLDAVINGGDLSTAPIYNGGAQDRGLTEAEYTNEIWNVKAMFDQYIPASVPLFTIDGNHERNYSLNGADMHMSDEAWAYVQTNFNTSAAVAHAHNVDVTYHRDLANAKLGANETGRFTGNSFHLDFRRLLASGGSNVRIACVSLYDGAAGGESQYRVFDAGQFYDAAGNLLDADLTPENTVMGMVAHGAEEKVSGVSGRSAAGSLQCGFMNGWSNPANKTGAWNLGTHPGRAFFGLVAAHFHFTNEKQITDAYDTAANPGNAVYASAVSVASAYAVNCPSKPKSHELGTEAAYHFSIFVVDTDANKLREIRVGGWSGTYPNPHENPVVQLHDFDIRTHLDPPPAPTLGAVTVDPGVTSATVSGTIAFPGTGATACDAYLAWGTDASDLPPPTRIAEGATASFGYTISDLTAETVFYYALTVSNNAATPMGAATSGSFTTLPASGDILPGETPEETRKTIQDAIDAAANLAEPGTVTLAAGLFEIDAQLMVTGGVTLAGQGMDLTAIRQTESGLDKRVMTVDGGSTVERLTITGGRPTQTTMEDGSVENNWNNGAGAHVVDGTISWCCISNNAAPKGNDNYGGGVFIRKGRIDHSIVADNRVATTTGTQAFGGGIAARLLLGPVAIDSCLVCGNSATNNAGTGFGGGIAVEYLANDRSTAVTILNTTIVGNSAGAQDSSGASEGGAVYAKVSSYPDQANGFSMMDCIVAGNATAGTNATVSVSDPSKIDWCLFDVGRSSTRRTATTARPGTPPRSAAARPTRASARTSPAPRSPRFPPWAATSTGSWPRLPRSTSRRAPPSIRPPTRRSPARPRTRRSSTRPTGPVRRPPARPTPGRSNSPRRRRSRPAPTRRAWARAPSPPRRTR